MLSKEKAMDGVRLFVFDMDGTVYLGDQPIEGSIEFIREVEAAKDRDYIFFTNNASKVPSVYVEKLRKMGLEVPLDKVVTAGDVCALYIMNEYPGGRVYLNGTPLLVENWKQKGINLVDEDPDVAVQSFDTTMSYEKMDKICEFVGDRLYTDAATGVRNGAKGFLVLTGEATMKTVEESDVEPTCIYESLDEMRKYI